MKMSEQINELGAALAKAQGKMEVASQDKTNNHYKSSYSTLKSVWEACREPLSSNGLSVIQNLCFEGDMILLHTMLLHSSGQYISSTVPVIETKAAIHPRGSAITYMKRYVLCGLLGITSGDKEIEDNGDDDGNQAQQDYREPKIEMISKSESLHLENMIHPQDINFKKWLISKAAQQEELTNVERFDQLPKRSYEGLLKAIEFRLSSRKSESGQLT